MSGKPSRKSIIRWTVISVTIIIVAVILESVISNYRNIFTDLDGCMTDVNALLIKDENGEYTDREAYIKLTPKETKNISVGNISGKVLSLRISVKTEEIAFFTKPIKVVIKGYDMKRPDTLSTILTDYITPDEGEGHKNILRLNAEFSEFHDITLSFSDITGNATVTELKFNPTDIGFRFNVIRCLLFAAVGILLLLIFGFHLNSEIIDIKKISHIAAIAVTCAMCIIITALFCVVISDNGAIAYPFKKGVNEYDPYAQQTDAFLKGQLHIDYPVSDELLALENPYDYDARKGIYYLWDRAMYDGKYYSYFGIAPILNYYLPFKLLTGNLPTVAAAKSFYLMMTSLFLCAFIIGYVIVYRKKISVLLLCIGLVSAVFSSNMFLIARGFSQFYYLAILAGTAYFAAFMFFTLLAVNQKHKIRRPVFFALAGLSYSMLLLSRLNMALLAAFIVIPVLWFGIIRSKTNMKVNDGGKAAVDIKRTAIDLASLGGIVAVTFIFTLWFNNARFGSPFEFGTNYQLTISDVQRNSIDVSMIPGAIYHYLLQPLGISTKFPFFFLQYSNLLNYGGFVYLDTGMGLLSIPLMLGLLLAPGFIFDRKKTGFSRWLCAASVIGIFVISVMNFCLGGVIFRYTADMTLLAAVVSTLLIFDVNESHADGTVSIRVGSEILMLASVFVVLCVSFCSNGNLIGYDIRIFTFFSELFRA